MNGTQRCILLAVTWMLPPLSVSAAELTYSRDVKPILSNNCFACHGPDEGRRKAGLRLDTHEGAIAELRSGERAVVPGDPSKSTLIQRVTAEEELDRMPPAKTGKTLTREQIEVLRRWIQEGARYDQHWAYVAPNRPSVPPVGAKGLGAIDSLVLASLEAQKLQPSPEADRRTLLRRLSFDLIGLPPTPDQVRAFAGDSAPDAYEKRVESLLASPQYGERMAVYWLDLVRYADSIGYHSDNTREVSAFRDYVIRAFNDNKPFDVFTTEQLAGDLLPNATTEQKIASGYNRLNMTTEEGGAQPKEYIAKYFADRVRNASTVWMAATLGCAECHDHKFDPYLARDFYSFGAFFTDVNETSVGRQVASMLPLPTGEQTAHLQRLDGRIGFLKRALDRQTPELDTAQAAWEQELSGPHPTWTVLQPIVQTSTGGAKLTRQPDGAVVARGKRPDRDTYYITAHTKLANITAIRLEILPDDKLPQKGPGRADNGNLVLSEFRLMAGSADAPGSLAAITLQNASADFSQESFGIAGAIDGKSETGWAVLPHIGRGHLGVFETQQNLGGAEGTVLTFVLSHEFGGGHAIGRFRLSVTSAARPVRAEGSQAPPKEIGAILAVAREQRTPEQRQTLAAYYRSIAPALAPVRATIAQLENEKGAVQAALQTTLVAQAIEPRVARVLPRGNWMDDSGEVVIPAVPAFLPALHVKDRRATRLDLAQWLVSPDNPLVARVFVNRLWKLMFGYGIARSLDDFGSQGEWPSHPELLDWLAMEFIESGWDVKHMVRLMATSRTYRQASIDREELRQRDPMNRLLARQSRFRLDAEMVRDNALAISGLLSLRVGGPSVKPYQPPGYWSFLNFPLRDYVADKGENQYRRGLYTFWQRTFLHPSLVAFDACSREEATVERARSNTPLQALVLLNDPTYVEAARVLAARALREGGTSPEQRLQFTVQQALCREPDSKEATILRSLYEKHRRAYEQDTKSAGALLSVGDAAKPADLDPAEVAAWTSVTRTILNLHETITRE